MSDATRVSGRRGAGPPGSARCRPCALRAARRRTVGIVIALCLALCVAGCSFPQSCGRRGVDVDAWNVTGRDVEVARQMGAPDWLVEGMERGEWPRASARSAVRYAELALDHMRDAHGQECEARDSVPPSLLKREARVTLVAVGGEHDGAEVTVTVAAAEGHACSDTWWAVLHADEFDGVVTGVLEAALSGVPEGSWASRVWLRGNYVASSISDDAPASEVLRESSVALGKVDVYLAASAVPDEASLGELADQVIGAYREEGYHVRCWLCVVPDPEGGEPMTVEYGEGLANAGDKLMTAARIFQGDAR